MRTFKAVLAEFESGETNPEVMDLVNINDETDKIMCAPDEFEVGDIVQEKDFYLEEQMMVDDQCYGLGMFAHKCTYKTEKVINRLLKVIESDMRIGDVTNLEELLGFVPEENLIMALPEEEWPLYCDNIEEVKQENVLNKIDWAELREQKTSLLNTINAEEVDYPTTIQHLEGLVVLINELQDYAVNTLGYDEMYIYDLDVEEKNDL